MEIFIKILVNALYFVALINPISKISIISLLISEDEREDMSGIIWKTTLIAILILLGSMFFGDLVLRKIFKVDIHSLRIAGGFILIWSRI